MKNLRKAIVIVLILVCLFSILLIKPVYASSFSLKSIMEAVEAFKNAGATDADTTTEIAKEIQPIINTLYWVGIAVVIGAAMFLGVEYFKATGDPKEKAEIQKKFVGFLISSAVLIAAYPIWSFLVTFVTSIM